MDSLSSLFSKAENEGLLQPLHLPYRTSLYVDDAVVFIQSDPEEISTTKEILHIFGEATGLRANFAKCAALPIQCNDDNIALIQDELPCQVTAFPCTYLGLPLSIFRLRKEDLQPFVDKVACRLPVWKAEQMAPIGRVTMVNAVLSSIPIYLLMAINVPKWVIKRIDKERNLLQVSLTCRVSNGKNVLFWEDNWIQGSSIRTLAPAMHAAVVARTRNRRTVREALQENEGCQSSATRIRHCCSFDSLDYLEGADNRVFNQQQKTWVEVAKVMAAEAELWRLANAAMPELPLPTTEWRSQNFIGD
uniref:Retrotransposon protein n=2 Tax=Oryza sativa subsp. japonica TaxID=39947 RepID=Q10JS9_ORYSJ|nr:putative retrotransposon protein [Oryza sativa Japonica Group]ABF96548.1 retrotransposon protein, putative, LINE subclass [Oryza sativa Japonica Group]